MGTPKFDCPHNEGVACDDYKQKPCHRCGWNPKVAQKRLEKICEKRGSTPEKKSG